MAKGSTDAGGGTTLSARRRDAERTRAAILRAATTEFALHGFSGARTERIVAAAGCNIRMLYHHFGSKGALYLAVIERAYDDLREKEGTLSLDPADPTRSVEQLLRFTFAYFEQNPDFEGLLRAENMMRGRFVRQSARVPQAADRLLGTLTTLIDAGEAQGLFRAGIDPVQLYVTITALSRFHLANAYTLSTMLRTDMQAPEWRAARLEHGVALLRAYLHA